jgi:hypothetical protein
MCCAVYAETMAHDSMIIEENRALTRRAVRLDVHSPAVFMDDHVGTVAEPVVELDEARAEHRVVHHLVLAQVDGTLSRSG